MCLWCRYDSSELTPKPIKRPGSARLLTWSVLLVTTAVIAGLTFLFPRQTRPVAPLATPAPAAPPAATTRTFIPYDEAAPLLEAFASAVPDLSRGTAADRAAAWPSWIAAHDAQIRARLDRGDEDSLVNFWLYGTSFTSWPRATTQGVAALNGRGSARDLLLHRLDDLVTGLQSPGSNERLRVARQIVERHGIRLDTSDGPDRSRQYLIELRERAMAEMNRYRETARTASRGNQADVYATLYHDRGLSSDTSIAIDFAVDLAVQTAGRASALAPGTIRRIAIIGPGLDFTDKAEGYDFYPPQTIQPFAFADSLVAAGLATASDLHITTLDLSPRVNAHLVGARERASHGEPYVIQLPLPPDDDEHTFEPALVAYWQRMGARIGDVVPPLAAPPGAAGVRVRAVRIPAATVAALEPHDLDIVTERLAPLPPGERFDLILATNILVYYGAFDQGLALANISAMLRPGGFFLTNYAMTPRPPLESAPALTTQVYWDKQKNGDMLHWYRRK